jgi:hypothetical protein
MAVENCRLGIVGCCLVMAPLLACAEPSEGGLLREVLQAGQSRLQEMLSGRLDFMQRDRPEWLVEQSHERVDPASQPGDDSLQLVVQRDRRAGADMLTLRHSLVTVGALRTYAGAGINRTKYFVDQGDTQELLIRRNRDSAIGAAAELGAELRMSEQLMVSADLRWADLADDAELLRNDGSLVVADPVVVGLTVGWRFR